MPRVTTGVSGARLWPLAGSTTLSVPSSASSCTATPRTREFALETMADDLVRLENLPGSYYNGR